MDSRLRDLRNSPEFAEEKLVASVQSLLQRKLEERGMNRADLAAKMGVSRARVSQIFSDNQNFTLRMVAKAFHALGEELELGFRGDVEFKSAELGGMAPRLQQEVLELSHGFEWLDECLEQGWQPVPARPTAALSQALVSVIAKELSRQRVYEHARHTGEEQEAVEEWMTGDDKVIPIFRSRRGGHG